MGTGVIEVVGEDVLCSVPGGAENRFPFDRKLEESLNAWAARYDRAVDRNNEGELAAIGPEMHEWLDASRWLTSFLELSGERVLEIRAAGSDRPRDALLLDAPWELLAGPAGPLAADPDRLRWNPHRNRFLRCAH